MFKIFLRLAIEIKKFHYRYWNCVKSKLVIKMAALSLRKKDGSIIVEKKRWQHYRWEKKMAALSLRKKDGSTIVEKKNKICALAALTVILTRMWMKTQAWDFEVRKIFRKQKNTVFITSQRTNYVSFIKGISFVLYEWRPNAFSI